MVVYSLSARVVAAIGSSGRRYAHVVFFSNFGWDKAKRSDPLK